MLTKKNIPDIEYSDYCTVIERDVVHISIY